MAMACAGCGFQVEAGFAFCPRCGRRLPAPCPGCGTVSPPDFAFCPRCGARLGGPEPAAPAPVAPAAPPPGPAPAVAEDDGADRRQVTVLFADLAGFTAIGERLDPEEVRAFQTDLFRELAAVIERYDGFVEKYVGDAVMAVFGAPTAHEDDPERALRAALAMHERVAALGPRWAGRLGRPVALHVGVNTGPVVAGRLGGPRADYAVTGDTVNTTARLQASAGAGQTLVSQATYVLTRHAFGFEPLPPLALKGKAEPVAVFRLLGAAARPRAARGLETEGLVAPLVGRDQELAQLGAAFERAVEGRAQVVSVIGDAGSGKSRLLDEFLARLAARADGGRIVVRRAVCSSLGEQPYGVIARFFREGYGVAADDPPAVARRKVVDGLAGLGVAADEAAGVAPILGYVLGLEAGARLPEVDPETAKRQIFGLLRLALERRLGQSPVLLLVEDLHWADAASMEGLRIMADWLGDRRLMVVFSFRPSLDAGRLVTSRTPHASLRLPPLRPADAHAILAAFFGPSVERIPAGLRALCVARAGGNPLYLEEIVRDLLAAGVLVRGEDGSWRCARDPAGLEVPATLQGLLLARVDRLPPGPRRLLQEAAVLGPVLDPRLLRRVAADPAGFAEQLEALREAELLRDGPPDPGQAAGGERPLAFTHILLQEVVYRNLLLRRRTELHGRAGQALEALRGERPSRLEDLEALGHHFALSDQRLEGARYLVAAGDWARGIYANDDAIRHYERALATLRDCPEAGPDELAVRERLGDLLGPAGRRPEAAEHYEAVRAAAEGAGDRVTTARLWRKLGGLHWDAGDRERALGCLQTGLGLLEDQPGQIELAHLSQEMGRLAFRSGDNAAAVHWAERALAQAEEAAGAAGAEAEARREAAAAVSHALNTLGAALARLGRPEEAVGHIERSVAVAREHGLLNVACRSYANLGVLYAQLDPGRAIETCQLGLETAKQIGDLGFQSRLYANLAVAYCALTDRCDVEGIRAAEAAIDLDRRLGQLDHMAVPLIVLGQIHQCHGAPDVALAYYREALTLAEDAGEPQLLFPCYDGIGTVHLDKGDTAEAERYLLLAEEVCQRAGVDRDSLVVLPFLC
jgi:predicted ATPase/class 3 adenylate cyclase